MFCRYCGELISDDAKFCPGCGEETPAGEFFEAQIPTAQVPVQIQIIQGGTQKTKPPTAVKVLLILNCFRRFDVDFLDSYPDYRLSKER